jgi:hypothetical protein
MMKSRVLLRSIQHSIGGALFVGTLIASSCTKEKINCGHGYPSAAFRFHLVDDRTGAEWFAAPRSFSLDTLKKLNSSTNQAPVVVDKKVVWSGFGLGNDYTLPKSGGDKSYTYLIRLSATDTDTIDARVIYGALSDDACPVGFRYAEKVEFKYNGRPNGAYITSGFYCGGCATILTFRKRP